MASENGILSGFLYSQPMKIKGGIAVESEEQALSSKFKNGWITLF